MKLAKNKRGFITDFIGDFYAFLAFILILILFFILFSLTISGCEGPGIKASIVSEASNELNEEMMMLNYLRTNVDVNGKQMSIAELIAYSDLNNDYNDLEEETIDFLEDIDEQISGISRCSHVIISILQKEVMFIKTDACLDDFLHYDLTKVSNVTIPLFYNESTRTAVVLFSYATQVDRAKYAGI